MIKISHHESKIITKKRESWGQTRSKKGANLPNKQKRPKKKGSTGVKSFQKLKIGY